jgi:hypothetical protein
LFLLFPVALGYLPYDHWDHFWPSVNVVLALGLVCVTLGAALVLPRSTISLTRQLLLGAAFLSLLSTTFGASLLALDNQLGRAVFSPHDTIANAMLIAAALAAAIIACIQPWMDQFQTAFSGALWLQSSIDDSTIRLTPTFSPLRI